MNRIPLTVAHYGRFDPEVHVGGVETFARNLRLLFDEVILMHPGNMDAEWVRREKIPVICDNHCILDWPSDIPLIAFQHGVAAVKMGTTKSFIDMRLAFGQQIAGMRSGTLWVACAEWIAKASKERYKSETSEVIYHPVDITRFDGRLTGEHPTLILHDARSEHKGMNLVADLVERFPEWRFEALSCRPEEVPDRMRSARAFLHLSRYEGNSIVCNEAMAMNLPCMFTDVGLMQDAGGPQAQVHLVSQEMAFNDPEGLRRSFAEFAGLLESRSFQPRSWTMANATPEVAMQSWRRALGAFEGLSGWDLGISAD